jgi:benzoyl-CoA reductase/2-hydroxyglutaryl-CoA dehydratase subunit BcrC/BadD/HgdB
MLEFLKLCGFETAEIEAESNRIKRAFDKLGITDEDIEIASQRLNKYYNMELLGVRKIFRSYIKELVRLVLAREEGKTKIIYYFMTVGGDNIGFAAASKSKGVYVATPTDIFQMVLGCVFNKIVPILEAAESKWLKAGSVFHCGNVKTIVGLIASDLIPKPDLLVTAGWMCDTAPKSIDLLSKLYDIPTYCYDTCQDRDASEYLETERIIDLSITSMRKLTQRIQEIVGFEITDEMVWEEMAKRGKLAESIARIMDLIEVSDPMPISATATALLMLLHGFPENENGLSDMIDATNILHEELSERVNKKVGVIEPGAPRIFGVQPPSFSDPSLEYLLNESGIALISNEGSFFPPDGAHFPKTSEPKDPYEAISSSLYNTFFQCSKVRTNTILEVCKRLKVDGVLSRLHTGCRVGSSDVILVKDAVKNELGLPAIIIELENFDPRPQDSARLKRRLDLFKTMLQNR